MWIAFKEESWTTAAYAVPAGSLYTFTSSDMLDVMVLDVIVLVVTVLNMGGTVRQT